MLPQTQEMKFIHQTIDHHIGALEMERLCGFKVDHQDLLHRCGESKQVEEQEINMLKSMLQHWHGIEYKPHMHEKHQQQMKMLELLKGEEFEKAFLTTLIHHHQEVVGMIDSECSPNFHSELKNMCRIMKERQMTDIQQMQQWLRDWYNVEQSAA